MLYISVSLVKCFQHLSGNSGLVFEAARGINVQWQKTTACMHSCFVNMLRCFKVLGSTCSFWSYNSTITYLHHIYLNSEYHGPCTETCNGSPDMRSSRHRSRAFLVYISFMRMFEYIGAQGMQSAS